MKDFLRSKNIKNSLWNLADIFLYPLLFFSSTPLFIDKLGEDEFGVWMLVNSIMITMQMFNLGLGTATFRNVALHQGKSSHTDVTETINTNFSLSIFIHIICIVIGIIISFAIKHYSLFNIESSFIQLASEGAILGGVIVGLKFYEQIICYFFKASERFDIAAMLNTGSRLAILFSSLFFVFSGYGLTVVFISTICISFAGIVIGLLLIKRKVPGYTFAIRFNKKSISKELNFALWTWFQSLAIIITFQCDRFFVVTYLGLATITYYGLVATMFNHIHMGFNAIVPWLAPRVTKLKSQEMDTRELYFSARNLCVSLSLTALFVFDFINPPIFSILLSPDKYVHTVEYIRLFTLFEIFFVYSIVPNYYLNAAGHERLLFFIVLGYCLAAIAGMLLGYYLLGSATGILAGLTSATALSMFLQNWIISRKVFRQEGFLSSLLFFLPAIVIGFMVLTDAFVYKLLLGIASLLALYIVFSKKNKINLNLIKLNEGF